MAELFASRDQIADDGEHDSGGGGLGPNPTTSCLHPAPMTQKVKNCSTTGIERAAEASESPRRLTQRNIWVVWMTKTTFSLKKIVSSIDSTGSKMVTYPLFA